MYARVVTFRGQTSKLDEGIRKLEESIPILSKNPGFLDIYCLADEKTGDVRIFALWESERLLRNASDAVKPVREGVARAFGSTEEPKIDVFEVKYGPEQRMRKAA